MGNEILSGNGASSCDDRAFAPSASSPQAVSPVPASIPSADDLRQRIIAAVGGFERFSRNWSWRSHSPNQRAESAIAGAVTLLENGVSLLIGEGFPPEQVEEWVSKSIRLWLAFQAAGARTANPMITGPANFPVERNRKAMETERKRGEEYYAFVDRPMRWIQQQKLRAQKAALSVEAASTEHRAIEFPGVKLVQNTTLNRIQLLFDGKPEPDTIAQLKREAFRWSPREGAWQRQNTNNGVQASYRILRSLGHGTRPASAIDARSGETEGLDPKDESAAAESRDAQNPRISAP